MVSFPVGLPLPHEPGFAGCILTGRNAWYGAFWAAPLATDTCIFILTLVKTRQYFKANVNMPCVHSLSAIMPCSQSGRQNA